MTVEHDIHQTAMKVKTNYGQLFHKSWHTSLTPLFNSEYMSYLQYYIEEMYKLEAPDCVFPKLKFDLFRTFKSCKLSDLKVVILGNEPDARLYSNGLAFGSYARAHNMLTKEMTIVKSNIEHTIYDGQTYLFDSTLESWAQQGVLLLNVSMFSQGGRPMEHAMMWRNFTREIIQTINSEMTNVVFVFTDVKRQGYFKRYIDKDFHEIIETEGLHGDLDLFQKINDYLIESDGKGAEITW